MPEEVNTGGTRRFVIGKERPKLDAELEKAIEEGYKKAEERKKKERKRKLIFFILIIIILIILGVFIFF